MNKDCELVFQCRVRDEEYVLRNRLYRLRGMHIKELYRKATTKFLITNKEELTISLPIDFFERLSCYPTKVRTVDTIFPNGSLYSNDFKWDGTQLLVYCRRFGFIKPDGSFAIEVKVEMI